MTPPRSSFPKRRKPIKRGKFMPKRGKKPAAVNKAAARKKLARYQAFMRSPEWAVIRTAAFLRAGHQCQETGCTMTTTLQAHHVSYSRFGGKELPKDLKVLCKAHHDELHRLKGTRQLWKRAQ